MGIQREDIVGCSRNWHPVGIHELDFRLILQLSVLLEEITSPHHAPFEPGGDVDEEKLPISAGERVMDALTKDRSLITYQDGLLPEQKAR